MKIPTHDYRSHTGAFAKVYECRVCGHTEIEKKPMRPGRGWGLSAGGRLYGRMVHHFAQSHPERLS